MDDRDLHGEPTFLEKFAGHVVHQISTGYYLTIALAGRLLSVCWLGFFQATQLSLADDKDVWVWGRNWEGQLGTGDGMEDPDEPRPPIMFDVPRPIAFFANLGVSSVVAGSYHTGAITGDACVF